VEAINFWGVGGGIDLMELNIHGFHYPGCSFCKSTREYIFFTKNGVNNNNAEEVSLVASIIICIFNINNY